MKLNNVKLLSMQTAHSDGEVRFNLEGSETVFLEWINNFKVERIDSHLKINQIEELKALNVDLHELYESLDKEIEKIIE